MPSQGSENTLNRLVLVTPDMKRVVCDRVTRNTASLSKGHIFSPIPKNDSTTIYALERDIDPVCHHKVVRTH